MMFKLRKNPSLYWWPVRIEQPMDGGTFQDYRIEVQFEAATSDELDELQETGTTDKEFLMGKVRNWREVSDENGDPLEFTQELLEQLLNDIPARTGMIRALKEANSGSTKGSKVGAARKTKN